MPPTPRPRPATDRAQTIGRPAPGQSLFGGDLLTGHPGSSSPVTGRSAPPAAQGRPDAAETQAHDRIEEFRLRHRNPQVAGQHHAPAIRPPPCRSAPRWSGRASRPRAPTAAPIPAKRPEAVSCIRQIGAGGKHRPLPVRITARRSSAPPWRRRRRSGRGIASVRAFALPGRSSRSCQFPKRRSLSSSSLERRPAYVKARKFVVQFSLWKGNEMNLRLTSSALALAAMTVRPGRRDLRAGLAVLGRLLSPAGYQIKEGNRAKAGDTLTISDLTITAASTGEARAPSPSTSPRSTCSPTGDGRCAPSMPTRVTASIAGADKGRQTVQPDGRRHSRQLDHHLGRAEDMTIPFDYPTLDLSVATVVADGKTPAADPSVDPREHHRLDAPRRRCETAKYDYDMKTEKRSSPPISPISRPKPGDNFKFDGTMTGLERRHDEHAQDAISDLAGPECRAEIRQLSLDGTVEGSAAPAAPSRLASTGDDRQPRRPARGKYDARRSTCRCRCRRTG